MVQVNRLLHRLRQVRELAGISLRSMSRRTGIPVGELRRQEDSNEVSLDALYRWRAVLGVPVIDLLEDAPEGVDQMLRVRAGMIQLMRSAKSLNEDAEASEKQIAISRNMISQLESMMPELKTVKSWPRYGSRGRNEPARIESQMVPLSTWFPELGREV